MATADGKADGAAIADGATTGASPQLNDRRIAHPPDAGPVAPATRDLPQSRHTGLDLLRGLAALSIVIYHYSVGAALFLDPAIPVVSFAERGVHVFFTISGYVILLTAYRSPHRRAFALARWVRLYPAFLISMSLTTVWVLFWKLSNFMVSPVDWLLNLTMLPGLFGAQPVDVVYWTLTFEIIFYAVVFSLLPFIKRGYALQLCLLYLIIAPILPFRVTNFSTFFIMGIAIYEMSEHRVLAPAVLVAAVIIGKHFDDTLFAPLAVFVALRITVPAKFAAWCGAVSYPLYLLHNRISVTLLLIYKPLSPILDLILAASVVILLAAGVHYFLEKPLVSYIKRSKIWMRVTAGRRTGRFWDGVGYPAARRPAPMALRLPQAASIAVGGSGGRERAAMIARRPLSPPDDR